MVTFSFALCKFQDWSTGMMIGLARERNGLYFLKEPIGKNNIKGPILLSLLYGSSLSNKNRIWLYHFCLDHPSFNILKVKFPSLFKGFDLGQFHCDVCDLAKHMHVSFPIRNTRSPMSFTFIHSDVQGPCTVHNNIYRARWSVLILFIDDYTQVSWVFLLKQKSNVSFTFQFFFSKQ